MTYVLGVFGKQEIEIIIIIIIVKTEHIEVQVTLQSTTILCPVWRRHPTPPRPALGSYAQI